MLESVGIVARAPYPPAGHLAIHGDGFVVPAQALPIARPSAWIPRRVRNDGAEAVTLSEARVVEVVRHRAIELNLEAVSILPG